MRNPACSEALMAIETAQNLGTRIVLISGTELAKLMLSYNIGCKDEHVLHLKKLTKNFSKISLR
jgi:restriction system protein